MKLIKLLLVGLMFCVCSQVMAQNNDSEKVPEVLVENTESNKQTPSAEDGHPQIRELDCTGLCTNGTFVPGYYDTCVWGGIPYPCWQEGYYTGNHDADCYTN